MNDLLLPRKPEGLMKEVGSGAKRFIQFTFVWDKWRFIVRVE